MTTNITNDNTVDLEGTISAADLRLLAKNGPIGKLSLTRMPKLTARIAMGLSSLPSVDHMWLWCDVTRTAMRHVVSIPGLRVLDVLDVVKPGRLEGFSAALSLEVLRANLSLSAEDMLEISTCHSLRELGAQGAELSGDVISALLKMPNLTALDLEGSQFDDAMAEQISVSTTITSLEVGATRLSAAGLAHLCTMKQLRSLDLWAIGIQESDLALLAALPMLEYVSIGDHENDHRPSFRGDAVVSALSALPSLKGIWLDGIDLTLAQRDALSARYEYARIS